MVGRDLTWLSLLISVVPSCVVAAPGLWRVLLSGLLMMWLISLSLVSCPVARFSVLVVLVVPVVAPYRTDV